MLIELITPLLLATAPMAITIEDKIAYSHQQQSIVALDGSSPVSYTANGTQTYGANGKPFDSDSD